MQRYNLTKKLFDLEEDSESSVDSVIYISSDSENEVSSSWDSDWSTDTEAIIERIEREVKAAPIPIVGRGMTTEELDDEMTAGPSSVRPVPPSTPKLGGQIRLLHSLRFRQDQGCVRIMTVSPRCRPPLSLLSFAQMSQETHLRLITRQGRHFIDGRCIVILRIGGSPRQVASVVPCRCQ